MPVLADLVDTLIRVDPPNTICAMRRPSGDPKRYIIGEISRVRELPPDKQWSALSSDRPFESVDRMSGSLRVADESEGVTNQLRKME